MKPLDVAVIGNVIKEVNPCSSLLGELVGEKGIFGLEKSMGRRFGITDRGDVKGARRWLVQPINLD